MPGLMPRVAAGRTLRLASVGTAAGLFSGLFGVGGGSVIVPLLILWLGYGEKEATGTSLGAIAVIAAVGAAIQAGYGNVDVARALLVAVPAVAGVLLGTRLQQRLRAEIIGLLFAFLLVAVAIDLLLE